MSSSPREGESEVCESQVDRKPLELRAKRQALGQRRDVWRIDGKLEIVFVVEMEGLEGWAYESEEGEELRVESLVGREERSEEVKMLEVEDVGGSAEIGSLMELGEEPKWELDVLEGKLDFFEVGEVSERVGGEKAVLMVPFVRLLRGDDKAIGFYVPADESEGFEVGEDGRRFEEGRGRGRRRGVWDLRRSGKDG